MKPLSNLRRKLLALLPFVFIVACILVFYFTEGLQFFTFDAIQEEYFEWKDFALSHPFFSAIAFIAVYIISVVLILPDSTFLTLLSGLLFPMPLALLYSCLSEAIGATLFFLAIRFAFKGTFEGKTLKGLEHMRQKVHGDQTYYLLFLRFSHLVPFWLINTGAALFTVKTLTFFWTTLLGVLPLNFFFVEGGASLSKYFETHTHFHLKNIFTPQLKLALVGLGLCALLPIFFRKLKSKRKKK